MKTRNLRINNPANDAVRLAIVVAVGVMFYAGVLSLEKSPVWPALQSAPPSVQTAKLSNKKTCIMVAWQKQSGIVPSNMDSLRCADYLPAQKNSGPMLAKNQ